MVRMSEAESLLGHSHDLADDEFLSAFAATTLPAERFRHADHVRLGWLHLKRQPLTEALSSFGVALRRFATAVGAPDLYHETVTWGFLFLVHERMATGRDGDSWPEFARRNPDLMRWKDGPFFDRYGPEILDSATARRIFVLPTPPSSQPTVEST
jgi:hypothetical protein